MVLMIKFISIPLVYILTETTDQNVPKPLSYPAYPIRYVTSGQCSLIGQTFKGQYRKNSDINNKEM